MLFRSVSRPARSSRPAQAQSSQPRADWPPPDEPEVEPEGEPLATDRQIRMLRAKSYSRARELGDFPPGECEDLHHAAGSIRKAALLALGVTNKAIPRSAVDELGRLIEGAALDEHDQVVVRAGDVPF